MAYNAAYIKQTRSEIARKIAFVLNARFRQDDSIAFDRDDLRFIIGGACFKNVYDYVSEKALNIVLEKQPKSICPKGVLLAGHIDGKKLVIEHPIPVSVLVDKLCGMASDHVLEENEVKVFLRNFAKIALISKEEDQLLRQANLNSSMPDSWDWDPSKVYARYDQVGVVQYDFTRLNNHRVALRNRRSPITRLFLNKNLVWHPSAYDAGVKGLAGAFMGDDDGQSLHVYTEDRLFMEGTGLPEFWHNGTYELRDDSYIARVSVKGMKKVLSLSGFTHKLSMMPERHPNLGNVYRAKIISENQDGSEVERDVLFVAAESIEFALRVFLANGIRVRTVRTKGYHVGFNGCQVEGGVVRRLLDSLGTEIYYSDELGLNDVSGLMMEKVLDRYPELLTYIGEGRVRPMDGGDGCNDNVRRYIVEREDTHSGV